MLRQQCSEHLHLMTISTTVAYGSRSFGTQVIAGDCRRVTSSNLLYLDVSSRSLQGRTRPSQVRSSYSPPSGSAKFWLCHIRSHYIGRLSWTIWINWYFADLLSTNTEQQHHIKCMLPNLHKLRQRAWISSICKEVKESLSCWKLKRSWTSKAFSREYPQDHST